MTTPTAEPDPLDRDAAEIDARSPDAPEQIEALIDHAEELGRDPEAEVDTDAERGAAT